MKLRRRRRQLLVHARRRWGRDAGGMLDSFTRRSVGSVSGGINHNDRPELL